MKAIRLNIEKTILDDIRVRVSVNIEDNVFDNIRVNIGTTIDDNLGGNIGGKIFEEIHQSKYIVYRHKKHLPQHPFTPMVKKI